MNGSIPWFGKIGAKLVLSRIPASYGVWRRLNLFAHGAMHRADYAYGVFERHFSGGSFGRKNAGFVALELGPGDSLSSALAATAHGAIRVHLVDVGAFATGDLRIYRDMAALLSARGLPAPDLAGDLDLDVVLERCNAVYSTKGLRSLREIPSATVDFVWSQAVLEHVRNHEFAAIIQELRGIMRPDGVCSHVVDLKDHLGGALNNMRIPSRWWEADWMARSGFYTNRMRMSQMVSAFEQAGFAVQIDAVRRWDALPTPRRLMASEFQRIPVEDLLVQQFDVTLRPI